MGVVNFRSLKTLVVEDNDFVRLMINRYLTEFGVAEIFEAANGMEGIGLLDKNPDIIICDINMEPLNGFEFLKLVRASPTASTVPVIFLTADASPAYVKQAIDLTANAYLVKPVTAKNLRDKIIFLLAHTKPS